jgi:hypothetical protein
VRPSFDELEAIVRRKICEVCDTRTVEGACGLNDKDACSLFQLFPYVAQAILATEGDSMDAYVAAIHEHVCSVCIDQRLDGTCPKREGDRCALNAYMPQIVEAIQEATGRAPARSQA